MHEMHFADALTERVRKTSPVCVGLDPQLSKLPDGIPKNAVGVLAFLQGILEATADVAACVKPNLAFFELLRAEGMEVFWRICDEAKRRGLLVIADGKRGDIGSTAGAYADAYLFSGSPVDALTVNPLCGSDGVTPFLERCAKNDKGIFLLVKTSNPSSSELQDLPVGDEVLHEHLAQLTEAWGTSFGEAQDDTRASLLGPITNLSCVGAVVGATFPEEMKYLRTLMPHCPFLIPGVGAQGGTIEDAKFGFLPSGTGAIVSASRSILSASSGKDWKEAARKATKEMAAALRNVV